MIYAALLVFLIGIIFLTIGIAVSVSYKKKNSYTGVGTATVIRVVETTTDYERPGAHGTIPTYYPVLEFYYQGNTYELIPNYSSSNCKYQVGSKVEIRFSPENPKKFIIEGDRILKMLGIIFISVGSFLIVVGGLLFYLYFKFFR